MKREVVKMERVDVLVSFNTLSSPSKPKKDLKQTRIQIFSNGSKKTGNKGEN
jgi:hypothetical protein